HSGCEGKGIDESFARSFRRSFRRSFTRFGKCEPVRRDARRWSCRELADIGLLISFHRLGFEIIMPAMEQAPIVAVVVVLIFAGASFFFALAETALFSLSKWQARQLAEGTPRNGGIVMRLLAKPQD